MQHAVRKKKTVLIASVLVVLMMLAGGWFYLSGLSSVISLDINPSVTIQTNCFDQIVSVTAVNEDGVDLLASYDYTGKDLDTVVIEIMDLLIAGGYIDGTTANNILITGYEANTNENLKDEVSIMITDYLASQNIDASLYEQTLDVDVAGLKDYDYNYNHDYCYDYDGAISAGKMAVIEQLMAADPTLVLEDLATMSINDLIAMAEVQGTELEGVKLYQGQKEDAGSDNSQSNNGEVKNNQSDNQNGNQSGTDQDVNEEKNIEQNKSGPEDEEQQHMNTETNEEKNGDQNQNTVQNDNTENSSKNGGNANETEE